MTRRRALLLPLVFCVAGLAGTVVLYLMIDAAERQRIALETDILAEQVRLRLEASVDARTGFLRHLGAGRFVDEKDIARNFAQHARAFVDNSPGLQALNYVDNAGVIRIVVPAESNAQALGSDLGRHPNPGVALALAKAAERGVVARTPMLELLQGGLGFALYCLMVDPEGTPLGYVNGVFRIRQLVDVCLPEEVLRQRFSFRLTDADGQVAYSHLAEAPVAEHAWFRTKSVRFVDRDLVLQISPSRHHVAESSAVAAEVLAIVGALLVLGLSILMRAFLLRQDALRHSRAKYQLLVENQSDFVVQLDPTGRLTYVSPSYCAACGTAETELLGTDFLAGVHPDDRDATRTALAELDSPPHRSLNELRAASPDGIAWQTWAFSAVVSPDGRAIGITAVGRDITHRRDLEEKLTQSRKMQAVGQLAGGIAHEFNNLLQSMLGNLQFVSQDTQPTGQTAEDLAEIERGIERAMALTRRLLTLGRPPARPATREDINRVVADAVAEFRQALRPGIGFRFLPTDDDLPVRIDRNALLQVVLNLCENAGEAISGTGSISVTTATRSLGDRAEPAHPELGPGIYAEITVQDDGRGMPPDVAGRVFEPFFTTHRFGAGSGLGLASSYGIIEQHEGTILVESVVGSGTTFTVLLPLDRSADAAPADIRLPVRPAGERTETILLAEDDYSVRDLAVRVLRRANYEVLTAEDGRQAVTVFAGRPNGIDLVILDMVMPGLNGREARDAIHAIRANVPVLFASGFDPATLESEHNLAPGEEVLSKPYGVSDLLTKVREILDRRLEDIVE